MTSAETSAVPPTEASTCSRAGCRDDAVWVIAWRNPRIHTADRRKHWVACEAHVGYLRDFLATRDFPLDVSPLQAAAAVFVAGPTAETA